MKTTLDIKDELLIHAKLLAKRTSRPLRAVVEEGLQLAISRSEDVHEYSLPDCSVGNPDAADPLESMTWQDLRSEVYGDPEKP